VIGGIILLPIALVINLLPVLRKEGPESRRRLHAANMIVGVAILTILAVTWGGLLVEQVSCLQGIHCD
jgi:hypothetical protein